MKKKSINSVSLWFRGSVSAFSKSSSIYNYFHITLDPELAVFFAGKGFIHAFTVNPGAKRFKLAYKNLTEKLEYPKIAAHMLSARTDLMTFMDQDLAAFKDEFRKARSVNDLRTALEEFIYDTGIDEDMGKNAAQFSDADIKEFRKWLNDVYSRASKSGASSLVSTVLEDLQSAGYAILDLDEEESIVWNSDVLSFIASIPTPEFKIKLQALTQNGLPIELFRFKKLFLSENEIDSSKYKNGKKLESKETTVKKQYTKKQIQEAIVYWEKQLKLMNESDYTASLIDNEDDCEVDSVECDCEELAGQIEQMMLSYGQKGNTRRDAQAAANAIKSGSYYTSSDGRFTIEP